MQKKKKICISFVFECLRPMRVEFINLYRRTTIYIEEQHHELSNNLSFNNSAMQISTRIREAALSRYCTNLKDTKRRVRRKNVGTTHRYTWIPLYRDATGIIASSIYSSFSFRQERCVAVRNQCKTAKRRCTGHKSQPGVRY